MNQAPRRALLSVSDKSGIEAFARALADRGLELVSTGGTARILRDAGLAVTSVSDITGHAEIMEGRVKTLHPAIHGPLLARRDHPGDVAALEAHGYGRFDVVAVNLYPFRETIARGGVSVDEAMEQVDIGGPTMIRAAAKNHRHVWVAVDPSDYGAIVSALDGTLEEDPAALRQRLAARVFRHIATYDATVADFLEAKAEWGSESGAEAEQPHGAGVESGYPAVRVDRWTLRDTLRYGENPDQRAALYVPAAGTPQGIAAMTKLQGKELSYNNLLDLDGALLSLAPFARTSRAAVAIVKHTTPCGLGVGRTLIEAFDRALATDPVSAFGGIIAVNRPLDGETAERMAGMFLECIVTPALLPEAERILSAKRNLRVLVFPEGAAVDDLLASQGGASDRGLIRSISGGLLVQEPAVPPFFGVEDPAWKVVTRRTPSDQERGDLAFAWAAIYGVKSNAILLARDGATLGIGAGQMSRVDASRLAVLKAKDQGQALEGAVLASDAFFPFRDGVDAAAEAGVRAIIQPGGSVRDSEVIEAANDHGMAMIFTGRRLFRH
jgi:phosphoribosylaminoimidazolecarboxamide formyltransferase / IMP cyclohydrolase